MAFDLSLRDNGGGFDVLLVKHIPATETRDITERIVGVLGIPAPVSEDKTGTVTGSTTSSGTIVGAKGGAGTVTGSTTSSGTAPGKKATTGTVTGSTTSSGTVVGKEGEPGLVTGTTTSSGTIVGTKATTGAVAGSTTSTGIIVGTKYDPDAPVEEETHRGGRGYYYYTAPEQPEPAPERKSGRVVGRTISFGTVIGRASRSGRSLPQAATARGEVRGTRSTSGRVRSRTYLETRITATRRELRLTTHDDPDAEIRRARDDADLLLIL